MKRLPALLTPSYRLPSVDCRSALHPHPGLIPQIKAFRFFVRACYLILAGLGEPASARPLTIGDVIFEPQRSRFLSVYRPMVMGVEATYPSALSRLEFSQSIHLWLALRFPPRASRGFGAARSSIPGTHVRR